MGVELDLGGIAKGYVVDRAVEIARQCGIDTAMISAGGDSRIIGDRRGRPWIIGVRHPRRDNDIALRLPLSDTAIRCSGAPANSNGMHSIRSIRSPSAGNASRNEELGPSLQTWPGSSYDQPSSIHARLSDAPNSMRSGTATSSLPRASASSGSTNAA